MTPPLIERIFGPNWRTLLSGVAFAATSALATLAALPYTMGDVATMIPPEWKAPLFKWSGIAAVVLKIINSMVAKDKLVSGNGTVTEPTKVAQPDGSNRIV